VARAKRTGRAEARRRYRATLAEADVALEGDDEPSAPAGAGASNAAARAGTARATPAPPPSRPGLASAFRESFRPIDLRGDLRALPQLLTHWSFYVPVLLSGASVAAIPLFGLNALTSTFYQYFSYTAPLGTAFIAGFFAPRASYLIGGLAAFASFLFQAIAFNVGSFGGTLEGAHDAQGNPLAASVVAANILTEALFVGVPAGAFFASAAAWYRRFLRRASPNRQAAAPGRRPDGKVPKRNQQRPVLARRR
jgi:hypothetical protein